MVLTDSYKYKKLLTFVLITMIIYLSGNVYFMSINYSKSVILVTLFSIITLVMCGTIKRETHIEVILVLLSLIILMLITILLNSEYSIQSYVAIGLQLIIAIILSNLIIFDDFEKIYIQIITFFATISLICFFISQVYPNVVYLFPKTDAIGSLDYYNAIFHVFTTSVGYDKLTVFDRNSGIFWEPGAYQAYLNIGIYFLFDLLKKGYKIKNKKYILFILILTVLSTVSTNGYIIMCIILISNIDIYMKYISRNKKNIIIAIMFIIFICILFIFTHERFEINFEITDKIEREFSNGGKEAFERIALDKLHYIFYDNRIYFFGMSFSSFLIMNDSCWNSIIHTMITLGIPFTVLLLVGYYKFSKNLLYNSGIFFLILIMCFSTETLFWRPFFTYFIFAGIYENKRIKKI